MEAYVNRKFEASFRLEPSPSTRYKHTAKYEISHFPKSWV